jgi:rhodanese-related sulfurtransferase
MTSAASDLPAPAAWKSPARRGASHAEEISIVAARELFSDGVGALVDVRELVEFTMSPHVPGAWFLPASNLMRFMGHPLSEYIAELSGEMPAHVDVRSLVRALRGFCARGGIILCFCRSGRRSLEAAVSLRALGCTRAVSVSGGILSWVEAGFESAEGLPAVLAPSRPGSAAGAALAD